MEKNLFEIATREKYQFPHNGLVSVQDLWDLTLPKLDAIFKRLNSESKQTKEESLLETKTAKDQELENKIEIIKYIVKFKQELIQSAKDAKAKSEEKQKLYSILERKEDEALEALTPEEIKKRIAEL